APLRLFWEVLPLWRSGNSWEMGSISKVEHATPLWCGNTRWSCRPHTLGSAPLSRALHEEWLQVARGGRHRAAGTTRPPAPGTPCRPRSAITRAAPLLAKHAELVGRI